MKPHTSNRTCNIDNYLSMKQLDLPKKNKIYNSIDVSESSSLVDIVEGVLYGRFVGKDELFGECFTLEGEDEFLSL